MEENMRRRLSLRLRGCRLGGTNRLRRENVCGSSGEAIHNTYKDGDPSEHSCWNNPPVAANGGHSHKTAVPASPQTGWNLSRRICSIGCRLSASRATAKVKDHGAWRGRRVTSTGISRTPPSAAQIVLNSISGRTPQRSSGLFRHPWSGCTYHRFGYRIRTSDAREWLERGF